MRIAFNILIIMICGMLFQLLPTEPRHVFFFVDYQISYQQLIWVLVARLTLAYFIYEAMIKNIDFDRDILRLFFWMTILDTIDYVLTANTPYGTWFSFNTISFVIFVGYIMVKKWRSLLYA